jgi:hypothetical protein
MAEGKMITGMKKALQPLQNPQLLPSLQKAFKKY